MAGINLELMREKLEKMKAGYSSKSSQTDSDFFKPELNNSYQIRVLPPATGDDPFREVYFHYNVGARITCPRRNYGKNCPVCDFATLLWEEQKETGDVATASLAKDLFAKPRYFTNLIVRGENGDDSEPKSYTYSPKVQQDFLEIIADVDYGDITDPKKGYDITLSVSKSPKDRYSSTTLKPRKNPSPLSEKRTTAELLSLAKNLDELVEVLSEAEIREQMDRHFQEMETKLAVETTEETEAVPREQNPQELFAELEQEIESL